MLRDFSLWARLLCLLGAGLASAYVASLAWKSVTTYETKYAFHADLPGGQPLTQRVVLVVMDGIRLDVAREMKSLQSLARRGSSGVARMGLPSLSNPNRAILATGAWPEVNGVTSNSHYKPPPVDSVFSLAKQAGLPLAVAGSNFWRRAFGEHLEGEIFEMEKGPRDRLEASARAAWQRETCSRLLPLLTTHPAGILVAGLTAADSAGHDFGGESDIYREAAGAVDDCIGLLAGALDDGNTTFVVISDHGHIHRRGRGGHGGQEDEVLNVPLVLAGKAIRKTGGLRAEAVDIAPTICALLGLPLPATNQGRILWQALDAPGEIEEALRAREAQQRALAASRLPDRAQGLHTEKSLRRPPAAAALIFFLLTGGWALRGQRGRWFPLLAGVGIYYAAYYMLFAVFGLSYSLSAIVREEYLAGFLLRNFLSAAVALAIALRLAGRWARGEAGAFYLDGALLITSTLGLQVTLNYFQSGLLMDGFVPDLRAGFKTYLDLFQISAVAAAAAALFIMMAAFERRRKRLSPEGNALTRLS